MHNASLARVRRGSREYPDPPPARGGGGSGYENNRRVDKHNIASHRHHYLRTAMEEVKQQYQTSEQSPPAPEEHPTEETEETDYADYGVPEVHTKHTPYWSEFTLPVNEQFPYKSPPFTTGKRTGYTLRVELYSDLKKPEDLNARVHMLPGEHDDRRGLPWPLNADVRIELCDPDGSCEPYTKNVIGTWNRVRGQLTGYSQAHSVEPFITRRDLDLYVSDGRLHFRIYGTSTDCVVQLHSGTQTIYTCFTYQPLNSPDLIDNRALILL